MIEGEPRPAPAVEVSLGDLGDGDRMAEMGRFKIRF
jgi:hypothetical protein